MLASSGSYWYRARGMNWISEQADAAWSTTNEELQSLVDQGQLRRVEAGETTRYQPDYTRLFFEEIRMLIEENTREALRNELTAITEESVLSLLGWDRSRIRRELSEIRTTKLTAFAHSRRE